MPSTVHAPQLASSTAAQIPIAGRLTAASQPLEAAELLPVGHRRLVGVELDPRPVEVVVDHLLAERLAHQLRLGEQVARGVHGVRHARLVGVVGVALEGGLELAARCSIPWRPAAIIAASARYGFTSAPGSRFSTRSPWPCPTTRIEQVRLSLPQATAVGANEPFTKRL